MQSDLDKKSILQMAMGSIEERVDYEMSKVLDNILDPNTKATGKRKITVTLEIVPSDDSRRTFSVAATAKATLTPTNPVSTSLYITSDKNGEMAVVEMVPNIPGQLAIDGSEQEQPKVLRLLKRA